MLRGLLYKLVFPIIWLWSTAMEKTKEVLLRIFLTVLLFIGYMVAAMVIYAVLRKIMVPQKTHYLPVHLHVHPHCRHTGDYHATDAKSQLYSESVPRVVPLFTEEAKQYYTSGNPVGSTVCVYPHSEFLLAGGHRLLSPGQPYTITLELEMPESPNNEYAGMFMVNVSLYSSSRNQLVTSVRPVMLHYKSSLLKTISTFFYVFPLLLGWSEQQQHISVEMMDNYYEPFTDGAVYARVMVLSHSVQLYSLFLNFNANFSGLAYYLYHWPISMSIIIVASAFISLCTVTLLMWVRKLTARFRGGQQQQQQQHEQLQQSDQSVHRPRRRGRAQQQHQVEDAASSDIDQPEGRRHSVGHVSEMETAGSHVQDLSATSSPTASQYTDTQDTESVISSVSEISTATTTDTTDHSELDANLLQLRRQIADPPEGGTCDGQDNRLRQRHAL